ncbi:MAG TPA: SusC/RagA family TonB-linked outer membrane protein [Gemmatimonadales bacterium]|nr:SusC/RagA family TonB-linked outer membrane protein [Gemmatimonadales bacterium]
MTGTLRWIFTRVISPALLALLPGVLLAQQPAVITGRVLDESNRPIPSATVAIPALGLTANTRAAGEYTIIVPAARVEGQTVTLTSRGIGHKPESVQITLREGAIQQDFSLDANPLQLGEIVVTGAGTVTQTEKLGAVRNNVSGEEVQRSNEPNVVQALAAKAPNVNVTQSGGEPGASSYVTIRGQRTIGLPGSGQAQPLFVVDGVPIDNSSFSTTDFNLVEGLTAGEIEGTTQPNRASDINPNDIESIEILKGPAAAAIYGSRAGQGVVLITTKKGSPGTTRYSFRTSVGVDNITRKYPLQTRFGQGLGGVAPSLGCDQFNSGGACLRSWGPDLSGTGTPVFDHSDEAYRTGFTTDNYLSVSGGTDRTLFYLSGEFFRNNGIFKGPNNDYQRISVRLNGSHRVTENLKLGGNFAYADSRGDFVQRGNNTNGLQLGLLRTPPNFDNTEYLDPESGLHRSYIYQNPPPGDLYGDRFFANPFWVLYKNVNTAQTGRVFGNVSADWAATPWLSVAYNLGADYSNDERLEGLPISSTGSGTMGRVTEGKLVNYQINHNLTATANYRLNQNLAGTVTLGQGLNVRNFRQLGTVGRILVGPEPFKLQNTVQRDPPVDNEENIHTESYFGQATLDLYDQLFLTAALRNDGSSTYSEDHRRSWFPKASVAWAFTNAIGERPWLTFGKLRFAYGEAGQDPSPYLTSNTFQASTPLSGITQGTGNLPVQAGLPGLATSITQGAEQLKPERSKEWEAGVDLGLFRDKADLSFTYYHTITEDVILLQPVAPSTGFFRKANNAAKFRNAGAEVSLNIRPITTPNFAWDIGLQWGKNKGRVLELGGSEFVVFDPNSITPQAVAQVGQEIGVLRDFGWVRCGLSPNGMNAAIQGVDLADVCAGQPHGALYLDEDGLPVGDDNPRIIANPNADWTGSVRTGFRFQRLSVSGLLDIRHGGDVYNGTRGALWSYGTHKDTEIRGTQVVLGRDPAPGVAVGPTVGPGVGVPTTLNESYFRNIVACPFTGLAENCIEDGGFVKLREISVGYTLDYPWVQRLLGFSSIDLRIAGRNLKTWTDYTGYDPEINLGGAIQATRGIDYFVMPQTRSFLFTLTLNR